MTQQTYATRMKEEQRDEQRNQNKRNERAI